VGSPLRSARLRRILLAYTVNRLGTWFGFIALAVVVYDRTKSAFAVAGLLLAGQVLPAFLVPAVVARVEASRRRGELSGLYFVEATASLALALLVSNFWLPAVLLLVAVDGTAALAASALLRTQLAQAARQELADEADATTEDVASDERAHPGGARSEREHEAERKANAALNVAFSATFMLGPALGGLLVVGAGPASALVLNAVTFLICGALLLDLHPHVEEAGGDSVRSRLTAAWEHLRGAPVLRHLLLAEALALVFFEAAGPVEVPYAKASLHAGNGGYGLLLSAWGVGVVIGSLVFARAVKRPLAAMLSIGTLAVGLAYIGLATAPWLLLACAAAVLGGFGQGIQWASLISAVQLLTPANLHGRMMGAVESIGAISPAFGLLFGGALAALTSPRFALLVVGIGASATTAAFVGLALHAPGTDAEAGRDDLDAAAPVLELAIAEPAGLPIEGSGEPRPATSPSTS
jgi:MFS family permease